MIPYRPKLKEYARKLRTYQTDAEQKLWAKLRRKQIYGLQFYRQKPLGRYIADFYCPSAKLVLELDGGQHYDYHGIEYDRERDQFLEGSELQVVRFSNRDIMENIDQVLTQIWQTIASRNLPSPLFSKEGH